MNKTKKLTAITFVMLAAVIAVVWITVAHSRILTIHEATRKDSLRQVKSILAKMPQSISAREAPYGDTPLHIASSKGHKDIAEFLLANGADVNAKNSHAWTPLHYAAVEGHNDVVQILLAEGAEVNAKEWAEDTPLHHAVCYGHYGTVELLLASGADVNAKGPLADTPLHTAVLMGEMSIVELLLAKGADLNAKNEGGYSPLDIAERRGGDIAELLRKHPQVISDPNSSQ